MAEDELVIEGVVHQLYSGEMLQPVHQIETADPQAVYQLTKKPCVLFSLDEYGKRSGEPAYANGPATADDVTIVAAELVATQFLQNRSR